MAIAYKTKFIVAFIIIFISIETSKQKCSLLQRNYYKCDSLMDLNNSSLTGHVFIETRQETDDEEQKLVEFNVHQTKTNNVANKIERLTINNSINSIGLNVFKQFDNLFYLSLKYNQLNVLKSKTFDNLNKLDAISIMNNEITTIEKDAFLNLPNLRSLRLVKNKLKIIQKIFFNNLPNLETLALSDNQIDFVEQSAFVNLPKLKYLYLNNNHLKYFIAKEVIQHLSNLERLWLHFNQLKTINSYMLEGLINLKVLNLAKNSISTIEPGTFEETPNLITLVLSFNFITILDGNSLPNQGFKSLEKLYLDHNRLTFLSSKFLLRLLKLRFITIGGNPWQCACFKLISQWIDDHQIILSCDKEYFSGIKPICVVPEYSNNVCMYNYDNNLYELYGQIEKLHPSTQLCLL